VWAALAREAEAGMVENYVKKILTTRPPPSGRSAELQGRQCCPSAPPKWKTRLGKGTGLRPTHGTRSVAAAGDACRDKGKSALPLGLFDTAPAEITLRKFDQDCRPVELRDFRNGPLD